MSWQSMHIFYYDNQDVILSECIDKILYENGVLDFFFIRYWENGPHIRLRLKDIGSIGFNKIMESIYNYIDINPSKMIVDEEEYKIRAKKLGEKENLKNIDEYIISNNQIKKYDYVPELKKYHGEFGIKIAEKEFIHSSKLVLKLLRSKPSQAQKYFYASVFAIILSDSLYETKEEKLVFFNRYTQYWKAFAMIPEHVLEKITKNAEKYPVNQPTLINMEKFYCQNSLYKLHKCIFEELNILTNNDLSVLERFCFNFVHLFNNRIGLSPVEEITVAYICKKILLELRGEYKNGYV